MDPEAAAARGTAGTPMSAEAAFESGMSSTSTAVATDRAGARFCDFLQVCVWCSRGVVCVCVEWCACGGCGVAPVPCCCVYHIASPTPRTNERPTTNIGVFSLFVRVLGWPNGGVRPAGGGGARRVKVPTFRLTDPVIHDVSLAATKSAEDGWGRLKASEAKAAAVKGERHGRTDRRQQGIHDFFASHRCGAF